MTTVLIVAVLLVASFIAGVCESNRVIAAVKAGQTDLHAAVGDAATAFHADVAKVHERIQALEVTTATRITAVEDSIKAKLP